MKKKLKNLGKMKNKITKKQKLLNKKERYKQTKSYSIAQAKKLLKQQDKAWSLAVKERDNNKCVYCGETKMVNAHHLIPRENKFFRHLIENGVTLCQKHHKFSLDISAHRNPFMFYIWFTENIPIQNIKLLDAIEEYLELQKCK